MAPWKPSSAFVSGTNLGTVGDNLKAFLGKSTVQENDITSLVAKGLTKEGHDRSICDATQRAMTRWLSSSHI
uniref:Uncharacterized protein n=1 Tax=Oryza meridionalis TaxID=40149 RepID=A0A0E0C288_9ORYZ